ncbi:hypothetical protein FHR83_002957 [Actinoplanes campanulatus]|uniref:Elongation factor Tu n=1 Tax=Actinoplanes campanulatus TaxID=113559 RepID=A0A7W5AGE1_9ACTN|nr:hypothetical protein [Actinoplanes campanulatus]MBB3095294.1 hypothetical protein [Actinoplanes campanulatus]GGN41346.1 hypothetical protein GCM10010109_71390 [Actinoplanes campanulatus]
MGEMRIEDAWPDPLGGVAVTGRLRGGPIRRGETLRLTENGRSFPVTVVRFLRLCGRQDPEIARPEENTGLVLRSVPEGLSLIGGLLLTEPGDLDRRPEQRP